MRKLSNASAIGGISSDVTHRESARVRPPSEAVWAELERIFSSPHFQASERRRAFLRFLISETLSGRGDSLKGYTIALAVFSRDESFDPQADPVVRLEARRLRRDLDSYYVDAGKDDAVRISVPKGSYVPTFEWHNVPSHVSSNEAAPAQLGKDSEEAPANGSKKSGAARLHAAPIAAIFAAGLAIGLMLWVWLSKAPSPPFGSEREPGVLVMPFEALSPGDSARYLAAGMQQELLTKLFQFSGFRLYSQPIGSKQDPNSASVQGGHNSGVVYVVKGSVQADVDDVRVTTSVVNATSGEVVWSKTFDRPRDPQSLVKNQREFADEIAAVIGQPYGVVRTDISDRSSEPAVSNMESYMCVLRAYEYRRTFLRAKFDPAMRCLEQAVQRDPAYSDAWAMLGWLHLDAGRLGFPGHEEQNEYEKALEAISRAVKLEPNNPLALKALASAYHFTGRYDESVRLTRHLMDLNPNDPEILAQLGWRLSVRGNFEEGVPLLQRAIERTLNPPGWYYHFIGVDLYLKGDYEQSRKIAERAAMTDSGFSQLLLAISSAELGDRKATQSALDRLARYEPLIRDPDAFLRRQGIADQTVNALVAGLGKARAFVSQ